MKTAKPDNLRERDESNEPNKPVVDGLKSVHHWLCNIHLSLIQDKDLFIKGMLAEFEKQAPGLGEVKTVETEKKHKRLLAKKGCDQEMYINDVITMTELKEKTAEINEALRDLDYSLKQYEQSLAATQNGEEPVAFYVEGLIDFYGWKR